MQPPAPEFCCTLPLRAGEILTGPDSTPMGHKSKNEGSDTYQESYQSRGMGPGSTPICYRGPWWSQRVLTLDGDGAQGMWSLYVLGHLMDAIVEEEHTSKPPAVSSTSSPLYLPVEDSSLPSISASDPNSRQRFRPCHYFDYICGRDTGGLHALLVGVLRLSVDDAIGRAERIYEALGAGARKSRPITSFSWCMVSHWQTRNSTDLTNALHLHLDENRTNSGLFTEQAFRNMKKEKTTSSMMVDDGFCKTFVLVTHKARKGVHVPYIVRSYHGQYTAEIRNFKIDTRDFSILDVAKSTLSDRGTYDSVKIPAVQGTFRSAESRVDTAMEAYNEVSRLHGGRIQCLLSIGPQNGVAFGRDYLKKRARDPKCPFLYAHFSSTHEREEGIAQIRKAAEDFCEVYATDIRHWAEKLVSFRRSRAKTEDWKRFAGMQTVSPRDIYATQYQSSQPGTGFQQVKKFEVTQDSEPWSTGNSTSKSVELEKDEAKSNTTPASRTPSKLVATTHQRTRQVNISGN